MIISATTVIFIIEASVKLGTKIYDVSVDEAAAKPISLPPGTLLDDIQEAKTNLFFSEPKNLWLIKENGPFEYANNSKLEAFGAYTLIQNYLQTQNKLSEEIITIDEFKSFHEFKQFMESDGPKNPVQRITGTVVSIGIDYALHNPEFLTKESSTRSVLIAFLNGLQKIDFAENELEKIAGEILKAALNIFKDNSNLIIEEKKLQSLLGGISEAILDDFKQISDGAVLGSKPNRIAFYKRLSSTILRGAGNAVVQNPQTWVGGENSQQLVKTAMSNILAGIEPYKDNYFTENSIEKIVQCSFTAIAQHSNIFGNNDILKEIIKKSAEELDDTPFNSYGLETIGDMIAISLDVIGDNAPSFIHGNNAELPTLAVKITLKQVASIVSNDSIKKKLSAKHIEDIFQLIMQEISNDPRILLRTITTDQGQSKTAVELIVSAIAKALGETDFYEIDHKFIKNLIYVCLRISIRNADQMLGIKNLDLMQTLLYKATNVYLSSLFSPETLRPTWPKEVFIEGLDKFLETVSTHLENEQDLQTAKLAVIFTIKFSQTTLRGKITGNNFPKVLARLVKESLNNVNISDDEQYMEIIEDEINK